MTKPSPSDIALHAYRIWEREGRPHGHDQEHWYKAEREILGAETAAEDRPIGEIRAAQQASARPAQGPQPAKKTAKPRSAKPSQAPTQQSASAPSSGKSETAATPKPRTGGKQSNS